MHKSSTAFYELKRSATSEFVKMFAETRRSLSLVLLSCLVLQFVVYSAAQTTSQSVAVTRGGEGEITAEASSVGEDGAFSSASASSTVNGTSGSAIAASDDDFVEIVEGEESISSGRLEIEVGGGTSTDSGNELDSTDEVDPGKEFVFLASFDAGAFCRCRCERRNLEDASNDYYRRKCAPLSSSTLVQFDSNISLCK